MEPDLRKSEVTKDEEGVAGSDAAVTGGDDGFVRRYASRPEHPQELCRRLQHTVVHDESPCLQRPMTQIPSTVGQPIPLYLR